MKPILAALLVLGVLTIQATYGQPKPRTKPRYDQIVRNDNTVIEALISEVNETTVVYRRAAAPTGAIYRVRKTDVNYVRYADGEIERFSRPPAITRQPPARQEPIRQQLVPESQPQQPDPELEPASKQQRTVSRPPAPTRYDPQQQQPERFSRPASDTRTRFGLLLGLGGGSLSNGYYDALFALAGERAAPQGVGFALRGGVTAEIPISRRLAFSPSVEYLRLGWTEPYLGESGSLGYVVTTAAVNTLYDDSKPINLYGSAGLYGAFGTGITVSALGPAVTYDDFYQKSFHLGVESKVGARFSHGLTVYAQFSYGLTNMGSVTRVANSLTQKTFGVGARYLFGN